MREEQTYALHKVPEGQRETLCVYKREKRRKERLENRGLGTCSQSTQCFLCSSTQRREDSCLASHRASHRRLVGVMRIVCLVYGGQKNGVLGINKALCIVRGV